jgi:hypothetical protein
MNAYEIRYAVLTDARQMLMDQWMRACDDHRQTETPGKLPPAPTFESIKALATEMYDFVKTKD